MLMNHTFFDYDKKNIPKKVSKHHCYRKNVKKKFLKNRDPGKPEDH